MTTVAELLDHGLSDWSHVLAHRADEAVIDAVRARFMGAGVPVELVADTLRDGGAALHQAVASERSDWATPFGGLLAVALLTAEVAAYCSHLVARASAVRSVAVDSLLEDFSAVAVASELGVSRQKVYEIGRGGAKLRDALRQANR
ncbi:hypothetical protein SAMN02745244_00456 [Tessaracoccus bendigoensis DSM 12906]|uniref:Uncharacterized protein n=1 Tax=Tessaracoccus bendigoensis DSM 12906 TaxID=1123357 RepID=A0A1M6BJT9_9ACTN|nr:hypothetical protein [Tessaracoccus bendigoensis]SHI48927.1 hypothetical protein SAMN02745244_00456 [Tessaracoccus bendigoensis DSM 12906]